jgi:acetyl esterase/lipase
MAPLNKNSSPVWELPQPQPQDILTKLQDQTPVDMSGVTTAEQTISEDGRSVKIYIMKPEHVEGKPGVILFIHGGVWLVGNFANHKRLLRDLVVGSGQVGVSVEYTPLPAARFPTQLEESYAALKWASEHAEEFGADGSRIAIAGNSVGGDMTAAENDPLRDEGEAYARKLMNSGVDVASVRYNGTIHDFVALDARRNLPTTEAALQQVSDEIRAHLSK